MNIISLNIFWCYHFTFILCQNITTSSILDSATVITNESYRSPFSRCHQEIPPVPTFTSSFTFSSWFTKPNAVYYIDLDLPPEERWNELVADKKQEIQNLVNVLREKADKIFGKDVFSVMDTYMPYITKTLPTDYYHEIVGISATTELTVGEITFYNIFYEFYSVCTSIVMKDSQGRMFHGRNLDFGFLLGLDINEKTWLATELLRPLIVKVEFVKNRQTIYSSVHFAGYIGILTAVKKNKFSLSINERFKLNSGYIGITEWILGRRDQKWLSVLTRDVMENAEDFKSAQKMLVLPKLIAPCYFILAGNSPGQGTVITRGRGESEFWNLAGNNHSNYQSEEGLWYLVQTNYDNNVKPPVMDDRQTPATTCMEKLGRTYPAYTLYNVLSTIPVLNKLTVYTAIMNVIEGTISIWIRDCPDPCWPW